MREDGKIDYIELPGGGDLPALKAFYATAFNCTFTDYGPGYTAMTEGLDGGFDANSTTGKPLVVLYASDLEAMEARIRDAGGTITRPIFTFPGGRRFHFTDPSGNELAAWSE